MPVHQPSDHEDDQDQSEYAADPNLRGAAPAAIGCLRRSGFSQQYISGLEQGRRNPTIVSIYELANALGVSHIEFVRPIEGQ
jgi:hypothetical protein